MSEKKILTKEEYIHSMHRFGRIATVVSILVMLSMCFIAAIYFDAMPNIGQVFSSAAGLLAIFIPAAIGEVISYTPILGSSIYLTLVTGNVTNLKLPVATNAMTVMDISYGSEDADVISSIAVSVSTFTTIIIIAVGVVLMVPLQPILTIPAVKTATGYILPSLFGCLLLNMMTPSLGGGITAPARLKGAIIPTLLVVLITFLDKYVFHLNLMVLYQGIVIIVMLPILYFGTKWLYNRGKIKVYLPGEEIEKKK